MLICNNNVNNVHIVIMTMMTMGLGIAPGEGGVPWITEGSRGKGITYAMVIIMAEESTGGNVLRKNVCLV